MHTHLLFRSFPGGSVKESTCHCKEWEETQVSSLGPEDPLEEEMASHSSILARIIPWTEEYTPWGHKELNMTENAHTHAFVI